MELKNTTFKYFLTFIISIVILSGCMYLYQVYTSNKAETTGRGRGPAPVQNPDGCYITLENGECAEPGSF